MAEAERDFEVFMQELEGDKEMRTTINLYKAQLERGRQIEQDRRRRKATSRRTKPRPDCMEETGASDDEEDVDMHQVEGSEEGESDEDEIRMEELLDDFQVSRPFLHRTFCTYSHNVLFCPRREHPCLRLRPWSRRPRSLMSSILPSMKLFSC